MSAASAPASSRPYDRAMIANVAAAIVHTPAASPSAPSVKFTTFITATIPTSVSALPARLAQADGIEERQRHVVHVDACPHRYRGRRELPGELDRRVEAAVAPVVQRAHERDRQQRAADDAARLPVPGQEDERRHHHRGKDRQTAQAGHGPVVEVAVARAVDDSKAPREPGYGRSRGERDQRDEERPEGIELVHSFPEPSGAPGGLPRSWCAAVKNPR